MEELQSDTSLVILPSDKGKFTVILNREDYLGKCMDHTNNGSHQLLKKDRTTKIKAEKTKQLKAIKEMNKMIIITLMLKMKILTRRILPRFQTTTEMFPLKMTR